MFSLNLPPKLLFFFAMAMLLARKSTQKMPNATRTHAEFDYFKLTNEFVDKALKIENAEMEIGWWKKHAFGILCDANLAKFELKMNANFGKLRKNFCETIGNDFSNENLLKIFVNEKEALEDLIGFVSNDKQIIDTKTIVQKIKNSLILSNENEQILGTMFEHLSAGTAIIAQIIKSKSFPIAKLIGTKSRRRKRMDENNQNNNHNGYGRKQIMRQAQLIHERKAMANYCIWMSLWFIFGFGCPFIIEITYGECLLWNICLSIFALVLLCLFVVNCRFAYSNSEPILPLI